MKYIPAKSIVTRKKDTSWFGTEYNMNIYKGCSHGCIYCDSRSSCYGIETFSNVAVKENALEIIRDDLRRKVKKGVVATGSMSDPYNPLEQKLLLTRHSLELINAFDFGVSIATKSSLVCRDIDVLSDIKEHSPVIIKVTVTTADNDLCKIIEPNVDTSIKRLEAVKKLSDNGIYAGILFMPILPFINDTKENILKITELAREYDARFIYPAFGVTLRDRQREYFFQKLDLEFKGTKEKYIKRYGNNYNCTSDNVKTLYQLFKEKCDEFGILYNMRDIIKSYKLGYKEKQLSIFDF